MDPDHLDLENLPGMTRCDGDGDRLGELELTTTAPPPLDLDSDTAFVPLCACGVPSLARSVSPDTEPGYLPRLDWTDDGTDDRQRPSLISFPVLCGSPVQLRRVAIVYALISSESINVAERRAKKGRN